MKKLLKLILPPFVKLFYLYINAKILKIKFYNDSLLNKNLNLKKLKKKNAAFIIATGPSIKNINLKKIIGQDCFTLSNSFLHKEINKIKPIAHFFAPYHLPIKPKSFKEWIKLSNQKLPEDTKIIMSYDDKNFAKCISKNRKIFYLKINHLINKIHTNICKPVGTFQASVLMIFPVLMFMGYKKIFLIGCDQNQIKFFNSVVKNYYNEKKDVRIATDGTKINKFKHSLDYTLHANLVAIQQFNAYSKFMRLEKVKVINLSQDSWLDMFEKNDLKNIST
jgi:hypothetical protein